MIIIESPGFKKLAYTDYNTHPGNLGRRDQGELADNILNEPSDSLSTKKIEEQFGQKKKKKKKRKCKPNSGREKLDEPELPRKML